MIVELQLRAWQRRFATDLAAHAGDDFLLVACPAAGKTIAAGAAIAGVMAARECDQLVVVCPTVVVRDQWASVLGELGFRMHTSFDGSWPEHVHGVCATYAQLGARAHEYAAACTRRGTAVILDEIHHAGEQLAWGEAIATAFAAARMRLLLSGTPFRSDRERIPFVSYEDDGACNPDFAYDYPRAVREGVCRSIEFRAHDGRITWLEGEDEVTATFEDQLQPQQRARRLRASLDPAQPYLAALLADAHADLLELRDQVPDAAGLVVCDSQAHAMEVDALLTEITGDIPVLAISDQPRAHQAIAGFAHSSQPWLVSVRMVAEGVDIPRLAVIAWATTSRTELMVRQVAGRALRGRGDHAELPAIVHMPADPQLIKYAGRLNVLGGVSTRHRGHDRDSVQPVPHRAAAPSQTMARRIDPAPFVGWFDKLAEGYGLEAMTRRCGWELETGTRRIYSWRAEGCAANVMTLYEACHRAGIDFCDVFDAPEYAEACAWARGEDYERDDDDSPAIARLRAVDAQPTTAAAWTVVPPLPAGRLHSAPEVLEISTPELPPSPEEIRDAEEARQYARAELYRLLGVYTQLRRTTNSAYQLASAHGELVAAVGAIVADAPAEQLDEAITWVKRQAAEFAARHPEQVKQIARTRRRLTNAA